MPPALDRAALHAPDDPASRQGSVAAAWFARGAGFAAGALLVVAVGLAFLAASRAVLLVFIALLLGAALSPLVGSLRGRFGLHRIAAILLVYAAFFVIALGLALVVVPGSVAQAGSLAEAVPDTLARLRAWADGLQPAIAGDIARSVVTAAEQALAKGPPTAGGALVEAGLSVADAVVSLVTVLALVFFWLVERARLQRFVLAFLPLDRRAGVREAWNGIEIRLGFLVRGQLVLMGSIALMATAICVALGLPSPLLLGLFAGLAEMIPMVGPAIGALPALLAAGLLAPDVFVLVLIAYLVMHLIEGNVLAPLVMGNVAGISPFLVIASLLIGGAIWGFTGALIAVPVAASVEVVLERLQARRQPVSPAGEAGTSLLSAIGGEQDGTGLAG